MKTLLSIFFLFTLTVQSLQNKQETETAEATFIEFADDTYYFTDNNDYSYEFQQINEDILNTYNLNDDSQKGKTFLITYDTDTEEDEEGDDVQIKIIIGLKLVK